MTFTYPASRRLASLFRGLALALSAACLSAVSLLAATPQGDFVLLEEGSQANSSYAMLGQFKIAASGAVSGTELLRASGVLLTADVVGTVSMDSAKSGLLLLTATERDADEPRQFFQNYRFVLDAEGTLHAVRLDPGIVSEASLAPASALPKEGSFVLVESVKGNSVLAQLTLSSSGLVSGKAWLQQFGALTEVALSGSLTSLSGGLSTLTLNYSLADAQGELQDYALKYSLLSTQEDGLQALRLDATSAAVVKLQLQ